MKQAGPLGLRSIAANPDPVTDRYQRQDERELALRISLIQQFGDSAKSAER